HLTNNELNTTATAPPTVQGYLNTALIYTSATGGTLGFTDLGNGTCEVRFTLSGDANLDGAVDVSDLGALASFYGATTACNWSQGDSNYDGKVDIADL